MRTRWDELLANSDFNLPFYSWAWYSTWWKHFGGRNGLFVVTGRRCDGPFWCSWLR